MLLEWLHVSVDSLLTFTPTGLHLDLHAEHCVTYYTSRPTVTVHKPVSPSRPARPLPKHLTSAPQIDWLRHRYRRMTENCEYV